MSFFYDLNKKLDSIRATPEVTHQQLNERNMSRAAKGIAKYTKPGMEKLSKLGREGASKAKMDATRKEFNQYDNEEVKEESGEWSKIPVGVIDGPGGYDGAQQRIKDYESGNINRDGKKLPPVVDKSRPADKQLPPVVDKSRPAKSIDEGPFGTGKKIYNVGKQAADEIGDYFSRNPKTGELNTLPDRDMRPGETFDTAWERMQDTRAMQQGRGEIKRGKYGGMHVDPKTGAYVPQPPVYIKADEGLAGAGKKIYDLGKRAASGINKMIGHGSDEELLGTLRKDVGVIHPTGGKRPTPPGMQSTGDTPRDIFLKGETGNERAVRLGDPRVKNTNDEGVKEAGKKLNFADKIANAKKEVDEMLGDVAAEAMRSALSPKQKKMAALGGDPKRIDGPDLAALRKGADMGEERSKGTAFDMSTRRVDTPKAGSTERGAKHDIKHSTSDPRYTGRTVTRRTDAQGISVDSETDDEGNKKEKRTKAGRPDDTGKKIGAKGPSGKSKLMTKEGTDQGQAQQVVDDLAELRAIAKQSQRGGEFPQGFASRLEVILYAAMTLIKNQQPGDAQVREEEKTSTRDDRAEKAGKKVTKDIEYDEENEDDIHGKERGPEDAKAEKAGKKVTKDIEHDEKKKDKEVDESTTSGSVATSTATKGSKGSMIGKGIYDSMNRELENMIAESMSINMSDSTEGNKSLTVTATDDDAMKLAMLLKSAGLGGHGDDMHSQGEQPCDTCGMPNCGCGDVQEAVDENSPDYPTNTEQADNNFGYAGGLNKPKTDVAGDGQTTIPNSAVHTQDEDALRRMMEMAGLAEAAKPDYKDGDKEESMKDAADDKEEDTVEESIRRMMEIAGVKKKPMDEQKTEEGNLFTAGLEDDDVKIGDKIPGTNAIKKKDIDESIFALNNQWRAYKG